MNSKGGWIGVDLDGTLAFYEGWKGHRHIGAPILPMLKRVKYWVGTGIRVKIFTARVSGNRPEEAEVRKAINAWCLEHIGTMLEITCEKDYECVEIWDDRAIQVIANTGLVVHDGMKKMPGADASPTEKTTTPPTTPGAGPGSPSIMRGSLMQDVA